MKPLIFEAGDLSKDAGREQSTAVIHEASGSPETMKLSRGVAACLSTKGASYYSLWQSERPTGRSDAIGTRAHNMSKL